MRVTYSCEWCGATVTKSRSPRNMLTPPRFCSQSCNGASQQEHLRLHAALRRAA